MDFWMHEGSTQTPLLSIVLDDDIKEPSRPLNRTQVTASPPPAVDNGAAKMDPVKPGLGDAPDLAAALRLSAQRARRSGAPI